MSPDNSCHLGDYKRGILDSELESCFRRILKTLIHHFDPTFGFGILIPIGKNGNSRPRVRDLLY